MPTKNKQNPATWSYSKINAFETCPKQFYHTKVAQDYKENFAADALKLGNQFHKAAEEYLRDGIPMPRQFRHIVPALDALDKKEGNWFYEYKMALTENLEPCGYFDEEVWWRGAGDVIIVLDDTAYVVDYKTSKSAQYADTDQLELMAMGVFIHFPEVQHVKAALMFVIANDLVKDSYSRDDEPFLWEKWHAKHKRMMKAYEKNVWNPNPSGLCKRHCVVTECPHNGNN